jgi:hypothetical protein
MNLILIAIFNDIVSSFRCIMPLGLGKGKINFLSYTNIKKTSELRLSRRYSFEDGCWKPVEISCFADIREEILLQYSGSKSAGLLRSQFIFYRQGISESHEI